MVGSYMGHDSYDVVALADKAPISNKRVLLAFVLTPLLISFVAACAYPLYAGLPTYWDRVLRSWPIYILFGALPATLIFGIPAFLLLRKLLRISLVSCAAVGA